METRTQSPVRRLEAQEYPRAAKTLAAAFHQDPVVSWWIPDADQRRRTLGPYFELALEVIYGPHDATFTTDDLASVAIWVPPDEWKSSEDELDQMIPVFSRVLGDHLESGLGLLALMQEVHPEDPHWYLPFIGTSPERQGQGLGSTLLGFMSESLDRDGLSAYLEASSERNKVLYLRHRFEVIGVLQIPEGPVMYLMWRKPR